MSKKHTQPHPLIKNPHLDGDPFYLEGGPIGVLLVHGFTASCAEMRPLGEYLHAQGYTVSAPLLPGHNTFPEDINRFTWQDWARTVEQAYGELAENCERVLVGGESTGGLLALYLASYQPEIAGLLTYAPALRLTLSWLDRLKLALIAPFVPYIQPEDADQDDGLAWRGYIVRPLKGIQQLLRLQAKTRPHLSKIRAPILIVQGRLDNTVHPDVPEIIYNSVNSEIKEIQWMDESSHCVVLDREMDQVNEITLNFIERITG